MNASESNFRLQSLEIDPRDGRVTGPGGQEVLDPRVMAVLMLMTHRAGQLVTHEDFLDALWPNRIVTDYAIYRCICVLRKQLSRAAGDNRYRALIETLPKRGYRFRAYESG